MLRIPLCRSRLALPAILIAQGALLFVVPRQSPIMHPTAVFIGLWLGGGSKFPIGSCFAQILTTAPHNVIRCLMGPEVRHGEAEVFTREFNLEAVRLIKDRGASYVQASQDLAFPV